MPREAHREALGLFQKSSEIGFRCDCSTGPWWELVRTQRRTNFVSVSDLQIFLEFEECHQFKYSHFQSLSVTFSHFQSPQFMQIYN